MAPGESKTVEIDAAQAFGPHRPDMVVRIDRSDIPDNIDPQIGQHLLVNVGQRRKLRALVTEVSEEGLTLDTNHPLAGKDLTFELEVVEIA
jgi:peptidylprolyl isomerase/FKBP-type peptidyl-prolyl cis-trans isomerase SlpA